MIHTGEMKYKQTYSFHLQVKNNEWYKMKRKYMNGKSRLNPTDTVAILE